MEPVASVVHTGDMNNCEVTYAREMDIEYNPGKEWITKIQQQLRPV